MKQMDDWQLLREYAARNSEEAFRALVDRYAGLVYHAALRQAGNPHTAEEVTQAVFIALAQKADRIPRGVILSGWLFRATRFACNNLAREQIRRQRREQEAVMMETILRPDETASVWEQIVPHLNDALDKLSRKDREAILVRFFQDRSHRELARILGVSEDAAKVRVSRALEKLRLIFARQGFAVPSAVLLATISAHGAQAAPAGLTASVASVAVAKGTAGTASTLTLIKGALKIMAWTKTKTAIVGVAVALLGIGTTTLLVRELLPSPEIEGTWVATELLGGSGIQAHESPKTRLVLKVAKVNGNYQVTGDDIDRGYKDVPVNIFTYKHRRIHAEISDIPDTFDGAVNLAGTKISGRWKEGKGGSGSLEFARTANPPPFPEALTDAEFAPRAGSDLQGLWQGWIGSGKDAVHFEIKIADPLDGTIRADFYCPNQKAVRQPTSVSYDGTTVKLMPMAGYGMFQGELRNGREMSGEWIQGGRHTPTKLGRVK